MKYYFWILGCAMNYSDAERMAAVLDGLGYRKTEVESEADLFIAISCSVRESAMLSIYGKVKDLLEYKKHNAKYKTILTGCVLEKDRKKLAKVFDILMTMEDLPKLPSLLHTVIPAKAGIQKEKDIDAGLDSSLRWNDESRLNDYFSITPHYESPFRAYVPISTGCDNFCSYCAVPYTKGREKSRPMEEIITEVTNLVNNGYKEITLLGQNVNSYGKDLKNSVIPADSTLSPELRLTVRRANAGISQDPRDKHEDDNALFSQLLLELDKISGDHRIYFYSNHPKDMADELIQTIAGLKHFPRYIHLPLQSGNNEILRKMNRHNTKEEYLKLVAKIRKAMPDVTLTTDIIVGYPGETEKQFTDTADVMKKAEYDMAFIAQYSPRPGTVSAKEPDDVPKEEKKRREKILQEIVKATVLKRNEKLVGTVQKVLVDEQKNGKYYGRTEGYKVVEITNPKPLVIPGRKPGIHPQLDQDSRLRGNDKDIKTGQPLMIGQFIDVKIESVSSWKVLGKLL